ELEERDAQGRRHAARFEHRLERHEHARGRAQEHRIDPPVGRDLPENEQHSNDTDARKPRLARPRMRGCGGHHGRFPRASNADTSVLRSAAIATTKAMYANIGAISMLSARCTIR